MATSSCSLRTGDFPEGEAVGVWEETDWEEAEVDWGRLEGKGNWAIAWGIGLVFKRETRG